MTMGICPRCGRMKNVSTYKWGESKVEEKMCEECYNRTRTIQRKNPAGVY